MALNILAVTSEAFPIAKTGGLGDAVSGLAQALSQVGPSITLMMPAYRGAEAHVQNLRQVAHLEGMPGGNAALLSGYCPELKLPVLLLKNDALYDRDGLYVDSDGREYADNAVRFAALAQAAARVAEGIVSVPQPHVVHLHDWHTALIPLYLRQRGVTGVKTALTLHNIAFQGVFPMALAPELGIEQRYLGGDGIEFWGQLNFLKAGIRYADVVTVVSANYAREILTPEFGCGLQGVLAERGGDLISIANGIDTTLWNPAADAYLPGLAFDAADLSGKARCKSALQQAMGLASDPGAVVLAMGSRLTTQKMADVAALALPVALENYPNLQVAVVGQGDKGLETSLKALEGRYPGRCAVHVGFDEQLAHLLHAGADILLHGSRFEPFGLTPLYSMRYGTIPIGSRVGGMVDTIADPGESQPLRAMISATGVLFRGDRAEDMSAAIDRALSLQATPDIWHAMQQNAMRADFSWARTAPAYLAAYQALRPDVEMGPLASRLRITGGRVPQPVLSGAALPTAANAAMAGDAHEDASRRKARKGRTDALVSPHGASAA